MSIPATQHKTCELQKHDYKVFEAVPAKTVSGMEDERKGVGPVFVEKNTAWPTIDHL